MEKQSESQVRNQLISRWPKIPQKEVDDIINHHNHLRSSLKKHYQLDERDAQREEESFFKATSSKKVRGARM